MATPVAPKAQRGWHDLMKAVTEMHSQTANVRATLQWALFQLTPRRKG